MGAVAFVVERRLLKVIRRRGREEEQPESPRRRGRQDVELAPTPQQVDDQAAGQQAAHDPQRRG
jgi:hypothetical protein